MRETAVVICNYNKADYVVKCIEAVLASDYKDFDVYVVDNASTDDSVEAVRMRFGQKVQLLCNCENLGGSGGFNTGLRKIRQMDYKYVLCLDNDAQVTPTAIGALRDFLEMHPEVGMAGSKVFHTQYPEYIQQMGLRIRFDCFSAETLYADRLDGEDIPKVVYCDTVAACSVMLPMKVLREVGLMPEDNFIYWDDMEWGYRVSKSGYKVAAVGASKVYHEMGAHTRRETTFAEYYHWRNSLNFFLTYTPEKQREAMSYVLLRSVFDRIYTCMSLGAHNMAKTVQYAFFDALMGVRGKADEGKILVNDENYDRLEQCAKGCTKVCVEDICNIGLREQIKEWNPNVQFVKAPEAEKIWRSCEYVMTSENWQENLVYVDSEKNSIIDAEDWEVVCNYNYSLTLFLYMHQDAFLSQSRKISDMQSKAEGDYKEKR